MRAILPAVLLCLCGLASAAPYTCPPAFNASQLGCTFVSHGGTTTFKANFSLQATGSTNLNSIMALEVSVGGVPCFSNFFSPVAIGNPGRPDLIVTANVNASCTFDVSSKQPVEVVAVGIYYNATPTYIAVNAESIGFVPDRHLDVFTVGVGTVASSDGAINCGSDCSQTYAAPATVTLTATAAPGSVFSNWSGDCSGTATSCVLLVSEIRNVTAIFAVAEPPRVVEFYNAPLDHYFITGDPAEAAAIDSGAAGPGWLRTGYSFRQGGDTPVCRFYGSTSPGPNSHFYSALAYECAYLKALQRATPVSAPRWNYEGLAFASSLPANGTCPVGTIPVYRAYNNGFARGKDSNHRITIDPNALQQVVAQGWKYEGIVMCAPPQ